MHIEPGKFYRTRDGRKIGPMEWRADCRDFVDAQHTEWAWWTADGQRGGMPDGDPLSIVDEWVDGPVRTRTVTEIVPGVYARVNIGYPDGTWKGRPVLVALTPHDEPDHKPPFRAAMNAAELRAAGEVLIALADVLSSQGTQS